MFEGSSTGDGGSPWGNRVSKCIAKQEGQRDDSTGVLENPRSPEQSVESWLAFPTLMTFYDSDSHVSGFQFAQRARSSRNSFLRGEGAPDRLRSTKAISTSQIQAFEYRASVVSRKFAARVLSRILYSRDIARFTRGTSTLFYAIAQLFIIFPNFLIQVGYCCALMGEITKFLLRIMLQENFNYA